MQNGDEQQQWQQPAQAGPAAPYQAIPAIPQQQIPPQPAQQPPATPAASAVASVAPVASIAPEPTGQPVVAPVFSQPEQPPVIPETPVAPVVATVAQLEQAPATPEASDVPRSERPVEQPEEPMPEEVDSQEAADGAYDTSEDDGAVIRWQAPEYLQQEQSKGWYLGLGVVTAILMLIAIFLLNSPTFAVLLPIMAVALVVYTKRPAPIADFVVSRKGVHVNDRLHPYAEFRSFGVAEIKGAHTAVLVPRKRFQLGLSLNFPEEVGEALVDMLAARLPMKEVKPDFFDKITSQLHL